MIITQNCVVPGMPEKVYHADPCETPSLSSSTLADMIESTEIEAKLNNQRLNPNHKPDEDTDASELGTIAHDFILRGERGTYEVAPFDDWRKKEAQDMKKSIQSRGLIALNRTTEERIIPAVKAMKKALYEQLDAHHDYPGIMRIGKSELSLFAHDGDIWNRARVDWWEESKGFEDVIVDYKTTGLGFDQWEKQQLWGDNAKYLQDLHYRRVRQLLTSAPSRFIFVVQRTKEPFLIRVIEIDQSCRDEMQRRYEWGRKKFINCLKTGVFAGEFPRTFQSSPPPWVVQRWEAQEMNQHMLDQEAAAKSAAAPLDLTMAG